MASRCEDVDIERDGKHAIDAKTFMETDRIQIKSYFVDQNKSTYKVLEDSVVYKYQVNRVPCKPEINCNGPLDRKSQEISNVLAQSRDGLLDFYPAEVLPTNIGSNRGMLQILKDYVELHKDDNKLYFITADCNIFMRIANIAKVRPNVIIDIVIIYC